MGVFVQGVSVQGVSVQGVSGLCPGGLCPGGLCLRGSLSTGVSVRETPLLCGQTDACEIITFSGGKKLENRLPLISVSAAEILAS